MESIKLKNLLRGLSLQVRGSKEKEIRRICNDSRRAAPGDLFIARKIEHAQEAINAGAVAIATEHYNPFLEIPQLITDKLSSLEAELGKRLYKNPSHKLFMVGITGTNGKTTTSFLCKAILDRAGFSSGLIGSLGYYVGKSRFDPTLTTPDILSNLFFLSEMVKAEEKSCCMEVSSHALSQGRVEGLEYDVAIFTQLTPEHLDYHRSMEEYATAKRKLFASLAPNKLAIINNDCTYAEFMKRGTTSRILTYGIENRSDIMASKISPSPKGLSFTLHHQEREYSITAPLLGKFNVYNILGAIAMALEKKIDISLIQKTLASFSHVPGRMQKISHPFPFQVYVDFSHTEDSLRRALFTLREITKGRIITVFGCGGCRYPEKRKKMGAVSSKLADISIITNDNPRTEDPMQIIHQIEKGFSGKKPLIEPDRGKAIKMAIDMAEEKDTVLIAGKGAEKIQIFAQTTHPWDDVVAAEEALKNKDAHLNHTP